MFDVYVGYDSRLDEVYKVCKQSIQRHSNANVIPIIQQELRDTNIYYRDIDNEGSTEFTITRFLVPYLSNYTGWSLFCDCDFLWTVDVNQLFDLCDDRYAVMVAKHDYVPKTTVKMDNRVQHHFPRKNWSSLMLFNNSKCKTLSVDTVNSVHPSYLHQIRWAQDNEIGSLPLEYNWLVGYYKETESFKPKAIHYTDGGPWFSGYENVEYSDLWNKEYELFRQTN